MLLKNFYKICCCYGDLTESTPKSINGNTGFTAKDGWNNIFTATGSGSVYYHYVQLSNAEENITPDLYNFSNHYDAQGEQIPSHITCGINNDGYMYFQTTHNWTNNTGSNVTIKSVAFGVKKSGSSGGYGEVLYAAYILDEPIVVANGSTLTITHRTDNGIAEVSAA